MALEFEMLAPVDVFLDDGLLEDVFSYLTPVELIKIERVSKRWQKISLQSWRKKKKLSLDADLGTRFPLEYADKILRRAGKYLTHLDTRVTLFGLKKASAKYNSRYYPEVAIYKAISAYCQQLVYFRLLIDESNLLPSGINLRFLDSSIFQYLKTLEVDMIRSGGEKCLEGRIGEVLKKATKLEEFSISAESSINGSCLLNLTKTCKKLTVYCNTLDEEIFAKALENLPNLKSLNIMSENIKPKVVSNICHKLETFIIRYNEKFFSGSKFKDLSLGNVRVLDVSDNEKFSDAVLRILIEKMPFLENLTMKWAENVSEKAFRGLGKLKHLKVMNVSYNNQISDKTIIYLAKSLDELEKVFCKGCDDLTAAGLLKLIDTCKKLNFLSVGNFGLTDKFLKEALKLVDERPKNSSLVIDLGRFAPKNLDILVPRNDRQLKYNYIMVKGSMKVEDEEKWMDTETVIRYVSGSSISKD